MKLGTRLSLEKRSHCWSGVRRFATQQTTQQFSLVMAPILAYWDIRGVSMFMQGLVLKPHDRFPRVDHM